MRALPCTLIAALLAAAPVAAQAPAPAGPPAPPPIAQFRPLPFHEIAERVADRYAGRMVAAETLPPRPAERDLGAELVYEFRLVTPQGNLLKLRIDARDGRFLEVAGRGQLQALRR
ncbi:PepSY domain-containing protein [Paracoccus spongiarum]|uniref:PepSY domain-containing protein n=1 Tax=Paracoccus spongiarum TaxID=3064387 RepID=A0ABT9JE72_9RHOB|nr:hypothetical protein [Paracoccus sp. 2205BS29-5]MDP5308128.1 hypothetical protein [Paracoccus sp. 2205BS29-5]